MSFSTYLSFSTLYEVEQSSSPAVSRCNSLSSEDSYGRRGAKAVANNNNDSDGILLRRDSNCSTSTKSSSDSASSSSSSDFDKRVHFASSSSSSSASSSAASSVYQSHSQRLHSHSKRYSTEDGSLPSANKLHAANEEQDLSLRRFGRR